MEDLRITYLKYVDQQKVANSAAATAAFMYVSAVGFSAENSCENSQEVKVWLFGILLISIFQVSIGIKQTHLVAAGSGATRADVMRAVKVAESIDTLSVCWFIVGHFLLFETFRNRDQYPFMYFLCWQYIGSCYATWTVYHAVQLTLRWYPPSGREDRLYWNRHQQNTMLNNSSGLGVLSTDQGGYGYSEQWIGGSEEDNNTQFWISWLQSCDCYDVFCDSKRGQIDFSKHQANAFNSVSAKAPTAIDTSTATTPLSGAGPNNTSDGDNKIVDPVDASADSPIDTIFDVAAVNILDNIPVEVASADLQPTADCGDLVDGMENDSCCICLNELMNCRYYVSNNSMLCNLSVDCGGGKGAAATGDLEEQEQEEGGIILHVRRSKVAADECCGELQGTDDITVCYPCPARHRFHSVCLCAWLQKASTWHCTAMGEAHVTPAACPCCRQMPTCQAVSLS